MLNNSESTWLLEEGTCLLLHIDKAKEGWWKSLLVGDSEIDTTKVDSTKRIEDYDSEIQGSIRRIIHQHLS